MKMLLIPVVFAGLILSGCSAAYKTGQTPDDVYYSRPAHSEELAKKETRPNDEYQSYFKDPDDNYLRMKVQNGGKWNSIDDYQYWNGYTPYSGGMYASPYYGTGLSFSMTFGNPWMYSTYSPYYGGMGYYNPTYISHYSPLYYPVVINKQPTYYNKSYRPSLQGYNNHNYDRGGSEVYRPADRRGSFQSIFNNRSNTNSYSSPSSNYDSRPSRSFSSPSSNSYSSPSSSGSSGGGRSSSGSTGGGRGGRGG